jgi:DNA-binding transcriptional ArsR family regulator
VPCLRDFEVWRLWGLNAVLCDAHELCAGTVAADRPIALVRSSAATARAGRDVREHPVYRLKAELFRTLGHPARMRLLALLGAGERTVGELQDALELDSSSTSQHLSALRRQGLLESRKVGTSVHCRVKDPRTLKLLTIAREILAANLEASRDLLGELDAEAKAGRKASGGSSA